MAQNRARGKSSRSPYWTALWAARVLFLLISQPGVASTPSPVLPQAVPDPAFERRLTRTAVYKIRKGDTLSRAAYFLYGRHSWWIKLRAQNPDLKSFGPDDRIPGGTRLKYRAPEVGETYSVQSGDWLIRIVEWKYGTRDHWEEVFRANSQKLSNPNLIHPGDLLTLSRDGTVTNAGTGKVLMDSQLALAPSASGDSAPPTAFEVARAKVQRFFGLEENGWFGLGLAAGLLVMVLMPVIWWFYRPDELPDATSAKKEKLKKQSRHLGPKETEDPKEQQDDLDDEPEYAQDLDHPQPLRPAENYPFGFNRRPYELVAIDPEQVAHDTDGEVRTRPDYHSMAGKRSAMLKPKRPARARRATVKKKAA